MRFFYLSILVLGVVLTTLYWCMYRRGFSFLNHVSVLLLFLLLPFLFALVNGFGTLWNIIHPEVLRPLAFLSGYWLAFFHYFFYVGLFYGLLRLAALFSGNGAGWQHVYTLYVKGALVLVLGLIAWGGWNAVHPVVREVVHDTGKHLPQPVKIVLVTDIHLGPLFGSHYAARLTEQINRQNPDIVVFGGDLIDRSIDYLLLEKSHVPLANIQSRYGVFAVMGNHDHFELRTQEEKRLFEEVGFHFLVDEAVDLPCRIRLAGLDDYRVHSDSRVLEDLSGKDPSVANLLVDHQPRRFLEAERAGYDLYLAGHTHGGQQAPLNLVTQRMYLLDYGSKRFGQMLGVVSCGYGLWGSPVRIGSTPEIVVITLR